MSEVSSSDSAAKPEFSPSYPEPQNLRGALWMLGSSGGSATSGMLIKDMGATIPSIEISFVRAVLGLIVIVPMIMKQGWSIFRTPKPSLHIIRIFLSTVSVTAGIFSFTHLHLATAVALSFTRPLFMIVLARFLLHEEIHWRRGLATVIGFIGVLIVVGPSDMNSLPGAFAGLFSAVTLAGTMVVIRRQAAYDSPSTILAWMLTGVCVVTAIPAYFVWHMPTTTDWIQLALLGVLASLGQFFMIKAFTYAEATVVNPVDYSQIILTTIIGYFYFKEVPTVWTVVGTAIIVASTLYIIMRDAALKKAAQVAEPADA